MDDVNPVDLRNAVDRVIDGIIQDPIRAAQLGLLPQGNSKVSRRGEFIVEPSNIESDENKKMRGYRHKEFAASGKALYGWGLDPVTGVDGPLDLVVYNPAEEAKAVAAGWSREPLFGPVGKLAAAPVAPDVPARKAVREFAAPGESQPFEQAVEAAPVRRKPGPKPKGVN